MDQPALKDIAVRQLPATGHVAIDFEGLGAHVELHPGHAIALIDRVLRHLMEQQDAVIQQGLQFFALDRIEATQLQGMLMLKYELANGLPFASHFSREELTTLRNQIDALLQQPEPAAAH
ncbi:MAG: hypothetical protein J0H69_08530 [Burkholderiales bacterium]|nr:hypothetical protein [Burkholderiales bacterium]